MSIFVYLSALFITICILKIVDINRRNGYNMVYINNNHLYLNKNVLFVILGFIPLWIVIAFRDSSVGTDTGITYYRIFLHELNGSFQIYADNAEPGYLLLVSLLAKLSTNYLLCIFVTGTISWLIFYIYILRDSDNIIWSVLIFFLSYNYFHLFNGIRQFIAMGIALLAFKFIYERKPFQFFVSIAIASTVHILALVYIPFYFLYKVKLNIKRALFFTGGVTVFFNMIWVFASGFLTSRKLSYYLTTNKYYSNLTFSYILIAVVMVIVGLSIQLLYNVKDEKYNINLWLQLFSLVIALNGNYLPEHHRIFWLFSVNSMIFAPIMLSKINNNNKIIKSAAYLVITLVFLLDFIRSYSTGMDQVQNYLFWTGI